MAIEKKSLKFKVLFLLSLFFFVTSIAQSIDPLLNQPDLSYGDFDKSNDALYFLQYYNPGEPNPIYAFDEVDFELIPFGPQPFLKNYVGAYSNHNYFVSLANHTVDTLYEYDGTQITEYELPTLYDVAIHLATFNNHIYFAAQETAEDPVLLSFDGSELVVTEIPETLFGGGNFYFSEFQNTLFLRLTTVIYDYKLWTFNGVTFNVIPNPADRRLAKIEFEFNDKLILSYYDETVTTGERFQLYTYEGSNLAPIVPPNNSVLYDIVGVKDDKLFLRYEDKDTEIRNVYVYDGTILTAMETSSNLEPYQYAGELSGKDYFIVYRHDTSSSFLYSFDGNELIEIPGPSDHSAFYTSGALSNRLLMAYQDAESKSVLVEYVAGNTEATLVPNAPQDLEFSGLHTAFEETLFISFRNEADERTLYGYNNSGLISIEVPETYVLSHHEFTTDQNAYFFYYSDILANTKLFRIDRTLNVTEVEQGSNSISVYPNPTTNAVNLRITDIENLTQLELTLYSTEGKKIDSKLYNQNELNESLQYNTSNLSSGVYLLELKSNRETITKKVIIN
ncbi:T9SS type A sorting domain-containing protein [Ulvibacter antarcticus]|uniref:Putative secreted protein (Por secretion system target) n=1 Tax=Ulvibacter antarcticus TaxID=442714 RepID=A0A3L9ZCK6_9FLAO|nr:T9SS type A sorting domain-containing protein [Ulvibacter antarcticus]RMA64382.1 putative secreted protein (Por secretion system target) [Ulvibacter antarcticus]